MSACQYHSSFHEPPGRQQDGSTSQEAGFRNQPKVDGQLASGTTLCVSALLYADAWENILDVSCKAFFLSAHWTDVKRSCDASCSSHSSHLSCLRDLSAQPSEERLQRDGALSFR